MKTFLGVFHAKRNDVNGNPRHKVDIYRIKNNVPHLIIADVHIGYRSTKQAIFETLQNFKHIPRAWSLSDMYRYKNDNSKVKIITV